VGSGYPLRCHVGGGLPLPEKGRRSTIND
jgi:hypothetical protein